MKRFMTILVIAAITLLAITAIAQAATSISVTATADYDGMGYTQGQEGTFTWVLNTAGVTNDISDFSDDTNYYMEEDLDHSQLFTNFTGTGLSGAYTRPVSESNSPWSGLEAGNDHDGNSSLEILVGQDSGDMGMTVDGQDVFYVHLYGLLTRTGFSGFTHSGEYINPSSYLANFSGTYGLSDSCLTILNTSNESQSFSPTSLTIANVGGSPVPEPGTILAAMSILGPAAMIFRRRKQA